LRKREWNEDQLEQLLQQLPSVKDKRTADQIYQQIQYKQRAKKRTKTWIAPAIATVGALMIFAIMTPYLFNGFTSSSEESNMDMATTSSEETSKNEMAKAPESPKASEASEVEEKNINESTIIENQNESIALDIENMEEKTLLEEENITYVTNAINPERTVTVGLTDEMAQNVIPVTLQGNNNEKKLERILEFIPEDFFDELGPVSFELKNSELSTKEDPSEVYIDYKVEEGITSSSAEVMFKETIQETFRWIGVKKAHLSTNGKEGILFGNSGLVTEIDIPQLRKKAYLIYQHDESTKKLLVPSPEPLKTMIEAVDLMKNGLPAYNLSPSIGNNIMITIRENDNQLNIEFDDKTKIENNEQSIMMLESLLLTAKDFGYKTVKFNGISEERIGVMDVTNPIEVPYSPNPIK